LGLVHQFALEFVMSWPERCSAAFDRSKTDLGQLTSIIYAVGGVLVSEFFGAYPLFEDHYS
jgi:hypothetical protein